jgi:hypothetical protein
MYVHACGCGAGSSSVRVSGTSLPRVHQKSKKMSELKEGPYRSERKIVPTAGRYATYLLHNDIK